MAGLVDKALFHLPRLLLAALLFFANNLRAEDVLLTVNVKKPAALTSDKFLSYTLDPTVVLTGNALTENPERSVNMAKALAPAYVRIGGPRSNSYTFERPHRQQDEQDPGFTFTEGDWIVVHRWAENAGLDVLACIAPQHSESGGRDPGWDSRNALDLISFSDHMGFNTSWQLGYECQTRCDASGIDIGRDVMRLRSMLDAFPRYSRSVITGPDVVTYRTKHQQQYLQDYLSVAGTALSAITWHPDFASITLDPEGVSLHHDNLAIDRDGLYRVVGRLISKKPLWLAESKPEECKKQFLGALVWTRRLGNAAKLGVQVLMRQPIDSNLIRPTPDYWVSVLHKALVGREVLDTKIATGNRTHVHFYCQCTKPSAKYEKGSLTIFGINLTPSKIVANLKGVKIKTLHKYILLPGFDAENRMFSETVLLNNEPLNLLNERELPEIKPTISSNSKGVALKLPSGGIGFWVIPGLKIKSCGGLEEDTTEKMLLKKLTKRLEETESDEDSVHEEEQELEDDEENASAEERRFSSKSSKNKRRRKHRYSEEDDAERRYRKLEARMDLERLEKLLRRRDSHDDRKLPRGRTAYFGFEEKSQEKVDDDNAETGEEIRAKLEEYKNRLKEHETRKKLDSRSRGKVTESLDHETIDSEKVVEALTLISKMENAMKMLEKGDDDVPVETLNPGNTYDVTSGLANPAKSENPEDMFLDELLKSEKIKRTSVPSKIEDQLRAIYQMLAEEKVRRQRNLEPLPILEATKLEDVTTFESPLHEIDETLSRARRDTEKKFGDGPMRLRNLEATKTDEPLGLDSLLHGFDETLLRAQRDTGKKFGDDPMGLRNLEATKPNETPGFDNLLHENDETLLRAQRDIGKKFGDDPMGLRNLEATKPNETPGFDNLLHENDETLLRAQRDTGKRFGDDPMGLRNLEATKPNNAPGFDNLLHENDETLLRAQRDTGKRFGDAPMGLRNLEATKPDDPPGFDSPLHKTDETLSRSRRDTDKKFGEDPLGLRKEGLFRRRTKNDDARERRMDRRRRKEKDDRKDGQPVIFDPRAAGDSNENNFYGFQQREPLKDFPEGDVFLMTGTSSEETAKDYDYVTDDEDAAREQERSRKTSRATGQAEPDDTTWVEEEDTELSHVPKEFFEDTRMAVPRVHENLREYGELWEAESLGQAQDLQDGFDVEEDEAAAGKIVQERRPDIHEDKRAKETAVRKLIGYYEDPRSGAGQEEEEEADYMDVEKQERPRSPGRTSSRTSAQPSETRNQRPGQGPQRGPATTMSRKRVKDLAGAEFGGFTDYDSMHFGRAAISSAEHDALGIYKPAVRPAARARRSVEDVERIFQDDDSLNNPAARARRSSEDIDQVMNQEMVFQDNNSLNKPAARARRSSEDVEQIMNQQMIFQDDKSLNKPAARARRSFEDVERIMNQEMMFQDDDSLNKPAARTRRSTEDVERIMDQEMIFQDDSNLKDCECRVNRGARAGRRRAERRHRPERRYSEDRGRFRNREKPPTTKPGGRFDEDYMHTTRTRRQTGFSSEEVQEAMSEDGAESIEDSGTDSEEAEVEAGPALDLESGDASGGEEDVSGEDDLVGSIVEDNQEVDPVVQDAKLKPANEDNGTSMLHNEGQPLTLGKNHLGAEEKDLVAVEDANDSPAVIEDVALAVENEEQDFETDNKVKRHNEENNPPEPPQDSSKEKTERAETEVLRIPESEDLDEPSAPLERRQISANDSEAGQFFLASPEDPEAKSKTVDDDPEAQPKTADEDPEAQTKTAEASQANLARDDLGLGEPGEDLQASSAEDKQSALGLRSVGAPQKIEGPSTAAASGAHEALQAENGSTESRPDEDPAVGAARDLLEAPRALNPNEAKTEEAEVVENRVKLEAKESSAEGTTETSVRSSSRKPASKHPRPTKDNPRAPRKTTQKTKPVVKVIDPAKVREARLVARTEALQALRRENESKKARKSLETATKTLATEQAKFQASQRKRAEQLEKLRDRLRTKRAKIVQEYRDELIGELDKASGEDRNIKRREIIQMINDDEELRDIVDQEKLDYLIHHKPIDYEGVRNENPGSAEDSLKRTKYVPEMVEILRPLHQVRERKVTDRGQKVRHATDPRILAYPAPEEATNSEAIRRNLRDDLDDHKVERRAGRSYYSIVESLENPRIRYMSDEDSGGDSGEVPESSELGQALSASVGGADGPEDLEASMEDGESEEYDGHHRDYRRRHAISESLEEERKASKASSPPRLARNAMKKNQYMCLKEDSQEASIEDQDEVFKIVKENDHYMAMPVLEEKANDKGTKEKYVSKKKHLKDSDYDQMSKFKTPKYARLAPEKIEAGRRANFQAPRASLEINQAKTLRHFDNEDQLQEIASKNARRKTKQGGNAEDELCSPQRKKSEVEVIDDLDLDEALNSSKYELLMLIPVKNNQKRSRQRRQVENELVRDDETSASNEIPTGIIESWKKDQSGNTNMEGIAAGETDDGDSSRTEDFDDKADDSSSVASTTLGTENSSSRAEKDERMIDGWAVEEILRSVPETIDHRAVNDDQGLSGLIEEAIPKLEATVTGGLGKARHISESFEKFIDGFDERFNRKLVENEAQLPGSDAAKMRNDSSISSDVFDATMTSVKKLFDFLSGMFHIIRFD